MIKDFFKKTLPEAILNDGGAVLVGISCGTLLIKMFVVDDFLFSFFAVSVSACAWFLWKKRSSNGLSWGVLNFALIVSAIFIIVPQKNTLIGTFNVRSPGLPMDASTLNAKLETLNENLTKLAEGKATNELGVSAIMSLPESQKWRAHNEIAQDIFALSIAPTFCKEPVKMKLLDIRLKVDADKGDTFYGKVYGDTLRAFTKEGFKNPCEYMDGVALMDTLGKLSEIVHKGDGQAFAHERPSKS